jgi:hypothetical protein
VVVERQFLLTVGDLFGMTLCSMIAAGALASAAAARLS